MVIMAKQFNFGFVRPQDMSPKIKVKCCLILFLDCTLQSQLLWDFLIWPDTKWKLWQTRRDHSPLHINGSTVEIVKSTKFLGVHLAEDLTWSINTSTITKKAQQRLYFSSEG
ncbi:hypothetical protein NFI96_000242 [Prochilodus magdalenae]|nr:hypothetical protein NFI96_000242 [Prochilodus magdalenae]